MILIYSIILIAFIILTIVFSGYKKEYKVSVDKKSNPLHIFYGFSFFITDIAGSIIKKFKRANSHEIFFNTRKKSLMLHPDIDSLAGAYCIFAKRISIGLSGIIICMLFGAIYCTNEIINPAGNITDLARPDDGSESTSYSLQVNTENSTEYIDVDVSKKIYEYGEIISLFDEHREGILFQMLGNNPSTDNISLPLSFPSSVDDTNIKLTWQPENISYIDYNGNLLYENISKEGTNTCIYVTMELEDVTASLVIGVTLYPPEADTAVSLKSEVQKYIDENNSPYNDSVKLPDTISGSSVSFVTPAKNSEDIFIILALISGIVLFFLSSKELDKKLKLRNQQLLQDYPEIVSKLMLLSNAGLNIKNSLQKIVADYHASPSFKPRFAYEELALTLNSLNSGKSEAFAYSEFGKRCGLMPYIKLGALLEQNLNKGTKELRYHLNNEVRNAFENHKADTITKSKHAETKLLIPMIMILIVIMLFIMVPSFMNI